MIILKPKYLLPIIIGSLVVVSSVALTKSSRIMPTPAKAHQEKQQTVDTLPLVVSNVKGIKVVKATLKNSGTSNPIAVLELKNKSNKAILAVSVEIGDPDEAEGITVNGFNGDNELPSIVIEPHGSITVELTLDNAKPGDPIRVSGVIYADDSEDGEKTALETIRTQKKNGKSHKKKSSSLKATEDTSPQ